MGVQQSSKGATGVLLEVFLESILKGYQAAVNGVISDLKAGPCLMWRQKNTPKEYVLLKDAHIMCQEWDKIDW